MITFIASLKNSGNCIKMDSDLAGEVTFSVDASQIAELIKLVTLSGKAFKVIIMETKPEGEK